MFIPINSCCKQEHHEHAWFHILCGRNVNLSTAPGLSLNVMYPLVLNASSLRVLGMLSYRRLRV